MAKGRQAPRRGPAPGITITYKGETRPPELDLDSRTIAAGQLFVTVTGCEPVDLYSGPDRSIFIVSEADLPQTRAGSGRAKRDLLRQRLGHPVEIIALARDALGFAGNLFAAFTPESIELIEAPAGTIIHVSLPLDTKGRAIGKGGSRLSAVRQLLMRQFVVKELVLT